MKLSELLNRLDSEESPYHAHHELLEELEFYGSYVDLTKHGFTCRTATVWNCTDSWVGTNAIYHNGDLICITSQTARKADVNFEWVSREVYKKTKDFVHGLLPYEEEPISTIDFNEDVSTNYKVDYTGQLIRGHHDKPLYGGRVVDVDWDATIKLDREDYLAKEAWVIDCGELKKVSVSELAFTIPLK